MPSWKSNIRSLIKLYICMYSYNAVIVTLIMHVLTFCHVMYIGREQNSISAL